MIVMMGKIISVLKQWWLAFARALGWFNTRVLLTIVYIFVIGIPAIVLIIVRKDLLDRKLGDRESYWVPKETIAHTLEQAKHHF